MQVYEAVCVLLLLLLCVRHLNCSRQWQPPRAGGEALLTSQQQRRGLRRQYFTLLKTSRDALQYGLRWRSWRVAHSKSYQTSSEALERYIIWRSNVAYIENHNAFADVMGFSLAMNSFGDMVSTG